MRKLRKQPIKNYSLKYKMYYDIDLEKGDRVSVSNIELECAHIYDIVESTGKNQRDAGILTYVMVRKNGLPRAAVLSDNDVWYWFDD